MQQKETVPTLACSNCQENILEAGFYNYCTETVSLREDNRTYPVNGRLYMEHDEEGRETTEHECDVDAFCGNCTKLLPWPLYEIRGLDGEKLADAERMIEDLIADAAGKKPAEEKGGAQ